MSETTNGTTNNSDLVTIDSSTELGRRAFALGKHEEAVGFYATALELMTEKYGENSPESAHLLFLYGKALLENAIAQNAVLGKEETNADEGEDDNLAAKKASQFVFEGDAEETVDFKQDGADGESESEDGQRDAEGDDDAPEDDFNAAWDALDLARALYEKQGDSEEVKLKVADTYIALGDVSLETEKFDQAISDYTAGLKLKDDILPFHHRQIAEAHYKLGLVLDLTSGRLGDAITHVQKAVQSIDRRLELLRLRSQGDMPDAPPEDAKGKGKAASALSKIDPIASLTVDQMKAEITEFEGLKKELENKIDDLKSAPPGLDQSAPTLAATQLTQELGLPGASSAIVNAPVNDISGMVKKKKKVAAPEAETQPSPSTGKRKLDPEDVEVAPEKKQRKSAEAESPA